MKICVVIPSYNHGNTVRKVALAVLEYCPDVIVVDDGSDDDVVANLAGLPIQIVCHKENRGKGGAIKSGVHAALDFGFTHIITLDADGQHLAKDLPAFLAVIKENPNAIVIGARDFTVSNVPVASKFGRYFSGFWMFIQTGTRVSDMQSGYRAYPIAILEAVKCSCRHYDFEIEIAVRAAWAGYAIKEIPIEVWYPPKESRVSHFKPFWDNLRISVLNARLTLRALTPIPFKSYILYTEGNLGLMRPIYTFKTLAARTVPTKLARSVAWSLFVSAIPIFGLNTIMLLFTINWKKLDRLSALVIVPFTWLPVIPAICLMLGHRILHDHWLTEFSFQTLGLEAGSRFVEWLVGSFVVAPILAIIAYVLTYCTALVVRGCK